MPERRFRSERAGRSRPQVVAVVEAETVTPAAMLRPAGKAYRCRAKPGYPLLPNRQPQTSSVAKLRPLQPEGLKAGGRGETRSYLLKLGNRGNARVLW